MSEQQSKPSPEELFKRGVLRQLTRIAEGVEGCQVAMEAILAELMNKTDEEIEAEESDHDDPTATEDENEL